MGAPGWGRVACAAIVGYAAGCVPSADIATRLATGGEIDLRTSGSGNPGAANAQQVLGSKWAAGVLVVDIAKGAVASRLGQRFAGPTGAQVGGTAAVVGHCFPATQGFRGGKGVGASVGQCAATFPPYVPIDAVVAAATMAVPRWKRRAFASTAVASAVWVGMSTLWWRKGWSTGWGPDATVALPLGAAASSAVIMYKFAVAEVSPR